MKAVVLGAIIALLQFFNLSFAGEREALASWIVQETKGKVAHAVAAKYVSYAYEAGEKWKVDPLLLLAIMKPESNYRQSARNKSGASGLMQVIPKWHREKIKKRNILNPRVNVDVGAQILDQYLNWHGESISSAINRYSGGASKKYHRAVQDTYKQLRKVIVEWKFINELHIQNSHRFHQPRYWATGEEVTITAQANKKPPRATKTKVARKATHQRNATRVAKQSKTPIYKVSQL